MKKLILVFFLLSLENPTHAAIVDINFKLTVTAVNGSSDPVFNSLLPSVGEELALSIQYNNATPVSDDFLSDLHFYENVIAGFDFSNLGVAGSFNESGIIFNDWAIGNNVGGTDYINANLFGQTGYSLEHFNVIGLTFGLLDLSGIALNSAELPNSINVGAFQDTFYSFGPTPPYDLTIDFGNIVNDIGIGEAQIEGIISPLTPIPLPPSFFLFAPLLGSLALLKKKHNKSFQTIANAAG